MSSTLCSFCPLAWAQERGIEGVGKSRVTGLPDINMVGYAHHITDNS